MIRYGMSSPDVDRQIELLKLYPEIADRHYRPALKDVTDKLSSEIRPQIPRRTGKAESTFKSKVLGKGVSVKGEVGWFGKAAQQAWYIRLVEGGTKAHEISGYGSAGRERRGILRFQAGEGMLYRKSVQHPGVSARGFMQRAWDHSLGLATQKLRLANEAIVRELALP